MRKVPQTKESSSARLVHVVYMHEKGSPLQVISPIVPGVTVAVPRMDLAPTLSI
jgi:hypothetical protein